MTLGGRGQGTFCCSTASWKHTILVPYETHSIQVELRHDEHLTVRRALHQASTLWGLTWDGPFRSQGSQGHEKRLRFQVFAPKNYYSSLGAHILCAQLKKREGLKTTNIGTEELANDIAARVITLAHITDASAIENLTSEILVLSPSEILVDTAATQKHWEDHIFSIRRIGHQPPVKEI